MLAMALLFCNRSADAFCFAAAGAYYHISPQLLVAISRYESGLNPGAINYNTDGSYDYGLMQINTIHADDLNRVGIPWSSLSDPCTNVMVGAWLLSQRVREYGYTWKAVGAYHSKTPGLRDRYAMEVAKLLAKSKGMPMPAERQAIVPQGNRPSAEMQALVWGQHASD